MDEGRGDPARRRLLSPPGGLGQGQLPRAPTTDLYSQFQRRFSHSLFLPPMVPRFPSAASGSAFSYYQGTPALAPAAGGGSHLSQCLSQPPFFSMNQQTPFAYAGPAAGAVGPSPLSPGAEQGPSSVLPPRGAGHRRSRSDFVFGLSSPNVSLPVPPTVEAAALNGVFGSYGVMGTLDSVVNGAADHARVPSSWNPADSSENEAEKWAAAGGGGAGPSNPRHCRSLSVDSFIGNLDFGAVGQESPKFPPPSPAAGTSGGPSRTGNGPLGGPSPLFATDLVIANGKFSEAEREKIMANDHLAEIALTDPKRVKRILANRVSAAKSKERKVKYMGELERRVHVLLMETSTLSAKVEKEKREFDALKTQNNEMKIRVQALEQQAQLKDALNEAMRAEVRHLKHSIGETIDPHAPNGAHLHMGCQMAQSEAQLALQQQQQQPRDESGLKAQQKQWKLEPLK